jgi:hypothetical protein
MNKKNFYESSQTHSFNSGGFLAVVLEFRRVRARLHLGMKILIGKIFEPKERDCISCRTFSLKAQSLI